MTFDFVQIFWSVNQIMFCDRIISSFTSILLPSAAILLVSIGEGHSSGIENVSHGTICIAIRQMKLGDFL